MDLLRKTFHDIATGSTRGVVLSKDAHIRHLSYADQIGFEDRREEFIAVAKKSGLQTDSEKLAVLKTQGAWSDDKDRTLDRARQYVSELIDGKKKNAKMPSMVKGYIKQIEEAEKEYDKQFLEKRKLLGLTCEVYADREINDDYIMANLFVDARLTQPLFVAEEFDYFDDEKVSKICLDYNQALEGCTEHGIKKLAMQPFFQRYFSIVGENFGQFFGKPICDLTFYQVDLIRYGAHFRNIYTSHEIMTFPKNVLEDPDLLTDYAAAAQKGREEMQRQGAYDQDSVVMGLNKEDAKALGVKNQPNITAEIMNKHGGNVAEWAMKRGQ